VIDEGLPREALCRSTGTSEILAHKTSHTLVPFAESSLGAAAGRENPRSLSKILNKPMTQGG
jgi:hypothetical protein